MRCKSCYKGMRPVDCKSSKHLFYTQYQCLNIKCKNYGNTRIKIIFVTDKGERKLVYKET